ncbi:hypothetical protein SUGI_0914810 [Cryptomeria japonica]|nr:hypothetical protein SUGI_0914810 [Cryptomeria japonica]
MKLKIAELERGKMNKVLVNLFKIPPRKHITAEFANRIERIGQMLNARNKKKMELQIMQPRVGKDSLDTKKGLELGQTQYRNGKVLNELDLQIMEIKVE